MPLALALVALLAPAPADGVGVVWSEATVDPLLGQRVLDAVEGAVGSRTRVIDRADTAARLVIAYEVDRAMVERQRQRLDSLEAAETAHRGGDAAAARAGVDAVLVSAREDPAVPGLVALLVRAHLLRAHILWTEGDAASVDVELSIAITLDPDARASTRRMPPDLVARHEGLRAATLASRDQWVAPTVVLGDDAAIELDGRAGSRPVPPGEHVVVIRRPGAAPVGAFVTTEWTPPAADVLLAAGLPDDADDAQRICDALGLRQVLLVRTRRARAAVQEYRCGDGFAAAWYGAPEDLDDGVLVADAARLGPHGGTQTLSRDAMWPVPPPRVDPGTTNPIDDQPRPWWKRGWVWGLVAAVVVGGVVTGAVLGTRPGEDGYVVDGDSFLERQ